MDRAVCPLLRATLRVLLMFCPEHSAKSMPARVSETFVLRTYPFREADLIVSFFTRDEGKLRGVARRARRPKSPFGSGLERLSHVRMAYFQKENAELANLSGCELIESQFDLGADYARGVALDFFTETAEHLLPPHEPNEKFFRLMVAVLAYLRSSRRPVGGRDVFFSLWAVRLDRNFSRTARQRRIRRNRRRNAGAPVDRSHAARVDESDRRRSAPRIDPHHGTARRTKIPDRPAAGGL